MNKVDFKDYIKGIAPKIGFTVETFNVAPYEVVITNKEHRFTFSSESFFYPCPSPKRIYFCGNDQNINLDDLKAAITKIIEDLNKGQFSTSLHKHGYLYDERYRIIAGWNAILESLVKMK